MKSDQGIMKAKALGRLMIGLCCLLFICTDINAQNWSVKPVINASVDFNGVHFTSDQTGYSVGTGGAIYITQDGGLSWTAQTSNTTNTLQAVFFINSSTGYTVGANGTIRKTINGGSTWTTQTNPSGTNATTFYGVHFPDPATSGTGYIVGSGGSIIKTTNGGTLWSNLTSGTPSDLQSLFFTSTTTGYTVGLSGTLRKTSNGGTSWAPLTISTVQNINDVQFLDANIGYVAGGNGEVWKTTDAGTIWTLKNSGLGSLENFNMHFSSASNGYVVTGSSYYYLTVDGAANWIFNTLVGAGGTINDMHFSSVYSGYMVGNNGTLVKYQSELEPEYQATSMIFTEVYSNSMRVNYTSSVDLPTGYLVMMKAGSNPTTDPQDGTSYTLNQILADGSVVAYVGSSTSFGLSSLSTNTGYYFKVYAYNGSGQATNYKVSTPLSGNQSTYINGTPWNSLTNSTFWYPRDVHFFDANIGGVGGGYSLVTSNDGGQNLTFGGSNGDSYDGIFFTNATSGYVVGGNGASTRVIMRTVNGGVTWVDQVRTIGSVLSDVWFTNSITGFAVGRGGSILRTTNGISWSSISSSTLNDLSSVHFPTPTVGYSVGQSGTIIKSTNGGVSWSLLTSPTTNQLHSVYFTDANTGYIAGDLGILYKTSNGGSSWTALISGTINELYEIQFVDASTGYTVGRNGTILKTIDAGANWYSFNTGADLVADYWGIHFPTMHTGYAVGNNGSNAIIYKFQSAPEPTSQPAGIAFSSILAHSATVSYSAASGSPIGYIVLRKELAAPNSTPLDGVEYVDGNTIGDATIVYVGPNLTFDESGLNASTNYHYAVYAYNNNGGEAGSTNYRLSSPLNGNFYSLANKPSTQPTAVIFSNITSSSLTASYTAAASPPTGYIAIRKTGSAPTGNPADGTPYSIGQALGDGTVAYVGSALNFNDTGLGGGNHYYYKIYSYNGTGLSTNYATGSPLSDDIDFGIPSITSFTPSSGPIGTTVIITGSNFSTTASNNIVYFGSSRAIVTASTTTQLTIAVPVGATYQPISVTLLTSGLSAYSKSPFIVTFPSSGVGVDAGSFTTDNATYATEDTPTDVVLADLDGDGKTDMISIAAGSTPVVSVFRSTAVSGMAATFADPRIDYNVGPGSPSAITLADLDGDGRTDIAVSISNSVLSILRNTSTLGSISFAPKMDYSTGSFPNGLETGDFNLDGRPDIACAMYGDNQFSVYKNQSTIGNISFASRVNYNTGTGPFQLAVSDIDGDGKSDVAVANYFGDAVSVFRNTSTSSITFAGNVDFATGPYPYAIALADLDGNGKTDMMITDQNSNVSVFRNTATVGSITAGSFAAKIDFVAGTYPNKISIADLDGDGKPDVATSNNHVLSNSISVFRNNSSVGTIALAAKVDFETGTSPRTIEIGDLDNDGRPDMVTCSEANDVITIHRNLVAGPIISSFIPQSGSVGTEVTITGSGFSSVPATNVVYFGAVKATVTSATATSLIVNVPAGATYQPITVTLNGLTAYSKSPFIVTFPGSLTINASSFGTQTDVATLGSDPYGLTIADLDGDGKTDVVVTNFTDNNLSVYRNTSTPGTVTYSTRINLASNNSPYGITTGDLDGDGKHEIISFSGGNASVSVYKNNSTSGSISFLSKVDFATSSGAYSLAVRDVDGDGRQDIVVGCNNNKISILRNIATGGTINSGSFDVKVDLNGGTLPIGIAIGDLNEDGKPDLAIANASGNNVSVFKNTGTIGIISFAPKIDYSTGGTSQPNGVAIGDLNGDGKPEIVTANNNSANVSVFKNITSANSIAFSSRVDLAAGSGPYSVAIGDMDGDGKPDLATANIGGASSSVLRNTTSAGSISFAPKYDISSIGSGLRGIAIGDIDNDGKPDLTVTSGAGAKFSTIRNINTLNAPAASAANPISQTTFTANWASVAAAADYRLDVSSDNFANTLANYSNLTVSVTSQTVTGLTVGTSYQYRVRSSNSTGVSANSTDINVLTLPATPTTNDATLLAQTSFTANWSAASGATSYKLDVSSISDFSAGNVLSDSPITTGIFSSVTGLSPGTTYYYRVRAANNTGSSPNSSTIPAITVPVAPTANAATSISTTAFTANWSPTLGASSYQFDVATNEAFTVGLSSSVIPSSATSVNLSSLTPGTIYYYRLRAANASGTTGNSNKVSTVTIPEAPTSPTNPATSITASGFTANWNSATGATQYNLDISTDNTFSSILSQPTSTGTSAVVSGLGSGTNYYYRVRASNGSGNSANSGTINVLTFPGAPTANDATTITSTSFVASWNSVSSATSYVLDVATTNVFTTGTFATGFEGLSLTSTSTAITSLTAGTIYFYRVRAISTAGTSSNSNVITTLVKPASPVASSANPVAADSFTANWSTVPGVLGYYLDVSSNNFSSFLPGFDNFPLSGISQVITGLNAGINYQYRVRSYNATGSSASSSIITTITKPPAPVATSASDFTPTSFTAKWQATTGASSYKLDVSSDPAFGSFFPGFENLSVTGTSSNVSGLTPGVAYYYRVRAVNVSGTSPNSNTISSTNIPPPPPVTSATSITTTSFTANWSTTSGALSYLLDVSDNNFSSFVSGYADLSVSGNSQSVTGLVAGTVYQYRVRAANASGISSNSSSISVQTLPAEPSAQATAITFSAITTSTMNISFATAVGGANGYVVIRKTASSPTGLPNDGVTYSSGSSIGDGTVAYVGSATNFSESGLSSGIVYFYNVYAYNGSSISTNYNTNSPLEGSKVTLPDAPVTLAATLIGQTLFNANWILASGATGYFIDVSTDDFSTFVTGYNNQPTGNVTSFGVNSLTDATAYQYRVRTVNASGSSINSTVISLVTIPPTPTALAAAGVNTTGFTANWSGTGTTNFFIDVSSDNFSTFVTGYNNLAVSGATSQNITGMNIGTAYKYRVRSSNATGVSPSSNAISVNTLVADPTAQPTALTFSNVTINSLDVSFLPAIGSPTGYLVLRKVGSSPIDIPTDGIVYSAGNSIGLSTVVNVGGTSFSEISLTNEANYFYSIYSYNGAGASINYLITAPLQGNKNTLAVEPTSQPTLFKFVSSTANIYSNSFTPASALGYIVLRKQGSAPTEVPIDGVPYLVGGSLGSSTVAHFANASLFDESLLSNSTYFYSVFSFNGSGASVNYRITTPLVASLLTLPDAPIAKPSSNNTTTTFDANWDAVSGTGIVTYEVEISKDDFSTILQKLPLINATTVRINNLSPSTDYQYRVRAKNASGLSTNSVAIAARTSDVSLANVLKINTNATSTTLSFGFNQATLSVNVSGGTGTRSVVMKHRAILGGAYASLVAADKGSDNFEAIIPESKVDELGLEYYFEATDELGTLVKSNGNSFIYLSKSSAVIEAIPFTSNFDGTSGTYEMFSVPYVLTDKNISGIFDELGAPDKTQWRLFHFKGNKYIEYPDNITTLELGKGYWFNAKEKIDIKPGAGELSKANQSTPFQITFEKGWNQIGNPYPFNIDWNVIKSANQVAGLNGLWLFEKGAYAKKDVLATWKGAFVFSDNGGTVNFPVTAKTLTAGKIKANELLPKIDEEAWLLPLALSFNGMDQISSIGMHPDANTSKDRFDEITMPRFIDYLEMDTYHEEFFAHNFSSDIVPTTSTASWIFTVASSQKGNEATIVWDHQALFNSHAKIALLDLQTQTLVDMKTTGIYRFSWTEGRQFKILYSKDGELLPGITLLGNAYPNPFNAAVTIPFMLQQDEANLEVVIYDMLGRKVKVITTPNNKAGIHNLEWTGGNEQGDAVESGMYFYQLRSEKGTLSSTKRLLKQ